MHSNEKFENLRYELLKEVQSIYKASDMTVSFREKFMRLIEICTFSLMNNEENFFAIFMIQMKRAIKLDMPSATGTSASISYFTIYFNPLILLHCHLEEMKALIKHEIYHLMYGHLKRAVYLNGRYSTLAINTAMDISINQYIKNLPPFMDTLESIRLSYNINLKAESTFEEYTELIQEAIDRLKVDERNYHDEMGLELMHEESRTHDIWNFSYDSFNMEQLEELIKKSANSASRSKMPIEFEAVIKMLNQSPEISWSTYLRKIIGTIPTGSKKIITRKDRRQPDRLELRGRLPDHTAQIAVAVDISGSMTDFEIDKAMAEIFSIVSNSASWVTIIECDSEIRRVYRVNAQNALKKKLNTRGGTRFSPVFKYLKDHGMRNCLLIYFTDGLGEDELDIIPVNYKTLWVLTGKTNRLSLYNSYGETKMLSSIKAEDQDPDYLKNEMRDILVEWQK